VTAWFSLVALSLTFVAFDVRRTPAHPVLKWAFVILAAFTGPFAALAYALGCRQPLKATHEDFVAARWRQALGSTMHCAAGDGLGIIAGAVIVAGSALPRWADVSLEYALGFGFGWAFFQAFAMREMAGTYARSLRATFLPELVSMNVLMAAMLVTTRLLRGLVPEAGFPAAPAFWFVMGISLLAGSLLAFPVNWWLVARGLKHGMITVRPGDRPRVRRDAAAGALHGRGYRGDGTERSVRPVELAIVCASSVLTLAAALLATG